MVVTVVHTLLRWSRHLYRKVPPFALPPRLTCPSSSPRYENPSSHETPRTIKMNGNGSFNMWEQDIPIDFMNSMIVQCITMQVLDLSVSLLKKSYYQVWNMFLWSFRNIDVLIMSCDLIDFSVFYALLLNIHLLNIHLLNIHLLNIYLLNICKFLIKRLAFTIYIDIDIFLSAYLPVPI